MLQGEHSAILLAFTKLSFVIKIFVLYILEWPFYTGLTVFLISSQLDCRSTFIAMESLRKWKTKSIQMSWLLIYGFQKSIHTGLAGKSLKQITKKIDW